MIKRTILIVIAIIAFASCKNQEQEIVSATDTSAIVDELIMSRRSVRKWKDRSISRDTLDIILKHGIYAPNGKNIQAYEVRVIDNPALLSEISRAVVKDNPKIGEREGFKNIFVDAPCVAFIAAYNNYDMSQIDCGLLGENIILSAWSMGIGSCCLGSSARWILDSKSAKPYLERLMFSKDYELLYCIALGYPAEKPEVKSRNIEKVMYIN